MGKLVSGLGQKLGLVADPNAGMGSIQGSQGLLAEATSMIKDIDIPDIQKQSVDLLKYAPELAGLLEAEQLGESKLADIDVDPRLRETQMDALAEMKERGETGLTTEDKVRFEALRRQGAADEQARQESILASMAQRGAGDSGAQLAAQLASSQGATQRAQEQGDRLAAEAAAGRRAALQSSAQMAGNIGQQDYSRQAAAAQSADRIAQQNLAQRAQAQQYNLGQRQNLSNTRSRLGVQQELANKGLYQQQFQNQMTKARGVMGGLGAQASGMRQLGDAQSRAAQQEAAGTMGLVQTGAQMFAMSDKNMKENITDASESKLQEMLDKLQAHEYDYIDGEDDQLGIMAQDLEKSDLGKEFVEEAEDGTKMIDYGKMGSTLAAAVSHLNKRLDKVEGKEYNQGGIGQSQDPKEKAAQQIAEFNAMQGQNFSIGGNKMTPGINFENPESNLQNPEDVKGLYKDTTGEDYITGRDMRLKGDPRLDRKNPNWSPEKEAQARKEAHRKSYDAVGGISGTPLGKGAKSLWDKATSWGDEKKPEPTSKEKLIKEKVAQAQTDPGGGIDPKTKGEKLAGRLASGIGNMQSNIAKAGRQGEVDYSNPLAGLMGDDTIAANPFGNINVGSLYAANGGIGYENGGIESLTKGQKMAEALTSGLGQTQQMINDAAKKPEQDYSNPLANIFANGGMNYEEGGEGTIIPGENYTGDELPDRINSGEMVLNVEQQDNLNKLLQALMNGEKPEIEEEGPMRTDDALENGEAEINRPQQEALHKVIRGRMDLEELPEDDVVKARGMDKLLTMLGSK